MDALLKAKLPLTMSVPEYRAFVDKLVAEETTTGDHPGPELVSFTKLNNRRMSRLDRTNKLVPEVRTALQRLQGHYLWVVITEPWCGDAAQAIPALAKMAEAAPNVEMRLILRDEHPDLMDQYLTNGNRSIPKLICIDRDTEEVVGTWGSRPAEAQQIVIDAKAAGVPKEEFLRQVQMWYNRNGSVAIQHEVMALLNAAEAVPA
ncbi:MAG: thioredoxin family protein [Bacteroidetes bacterium]|nr:MAG: thioredoxin family protein [Bacteroidota bacterium]